MMYSRTKKVSFAEAPPVWLYPVKGDAEHLEWIRADDIEDLGSQSDEDVVQTRQTKALSRGSSSSGLSQQGLARRSSSSDLSQMQGLARRSSCSDFAQMQALEDSDTEDGFDWSFSPHHEAQEEEDGFDWSFSPQHEAQEDSDTEDGFDWSFSPHHEVQEDDANAGSLSRATTEKPTKKKEEECASGSCEKSAHTGVEAGATALCNETEAEEAANSRGPAAEGAANSRGDEEDDDDETARLEAEAAANSPGEEEESARAEAEDVDVPNFDNNDDSLLLRAQALYQELFDFSELRHDLAELKRNLPTLNDLMYWTCLGGRGH
eukprot:TRINITY_DN5474_c0_g1_i3.p1 TRINITY_DN5474_c0_g1~~TRINITY_DN5474_c0_g1_i3.p1  ORF type:complete len:321 (-),score=100.22 TRINITY_DN5474_c0_g1_i3:112-1074(-)